MVKMHKWEWWRVELPCALTAASAFSTIERSDSPADSASHSHLSADNETPARRSDLCLFLVILKRASMTLERETRKVDLDTPEFAVPTENLIPVNDYPNHMQAIPPSRMFEIKKALDGYVARVGAGAETYDASQGDGGASLPGVPPEILMRAAELQVQHGTGYDQPFGTK